MTPLAFIDTETTSLNRPASKTPGEVWEVAAIIRRAGDLGVYESEHRWLLPVDLAHADPVSLDICRFHERHPAGDRYVYEPTKLPVTLRSVFAKEFAELTDGCHLVGNVVSFDEERLAAILDEHDLKPGWHYHLIDVEALAVGWLAASRDPGDPTPLSQDKCEPPWDSEELCAALGVSIPTDDRHTALGDARWAQATYDAVIASEDQ